MVKQNFKKWIDALLTMVLTLFIAVLFYFAFGKIIFEMFVSNTSESDVLTYYYCIENGNNRVSGLDENVVIFDISGEKSRETIANAIKRIGECNPRKIGVDIIFSEASGVSPYVDSLLENVMSSMPGIVTASRAIKVQDSDEHYLERSFYADKPGMVTGLVNAEDLCDYKTSYQINGDTICSFTSQIADDRDTRTGKAVNYTGKAFVTVHISEPIDAIDFQNKIVLIGDLKDLRDTHDSPFPINGSRRVPGVLIAAYTISSIVNNDWIIKVPEFVNILIGIIITYLFTVLCYWLKQRFALGNLSEKLIQISGFIALTILGYLIFTYFDRSVNIIYGLIGVVLMGLSMDILEWMQKVIRKKRAHDKES